MALSAGIAWEVRTGGSDSLCGGGFRGGALIATPSAPTVTPSGSGGTVANGTYYCVVTYSDEYGETQKSPETSTGALTGGSSSFTVTAPAAATNICAWNLYVATSSGGPYWSQGSNLAPGTNQVVTTTPPTSGTQAPGVDRSQQNSAQLHIDNSTVTATTTGANSNTITFTAGYTPTSADVGNCIYMNGGTNINVGVYEIIAYTSTTWTVSGAANLTTAGGAGSALLGWMGGAFASPGHAYSYAVGANLMYVASGTYTMLASSNVSGGRLIPPGGAAGRLTTIWGYGSTRGDDGTKPVFQPSTSSVTLITLSNNAVLVRNVEFQANSQTGCVGIASTGFDDVIRRCKFNTIATAINCTGTSVITIYDCEFTGITSAITPTGAGPYVMRNCSLHGGSATLNIVARQTLVDGCLFSGLGADAMTFISGVNSVVVRNCTVDSCQNGAVLAGPPNNVVFENCIFSNAPSTKYGIKNVSTGFQGNVARNCAGWNNAAGDVLYVTQEGWITLTGSPYNNAAGGDFSLNSTAGAGAACKGAGIPSSFGGQSTSSYPSVGAAQPQPTVAGGVSQQQTGTRAMIVRVPEPTASKVIPTQPPAVTGNVQQQQTGTRSTAGY
jgi:hypothetical protein